jgi:tRNA pseudouridine55 synthase
MRQNVSVMNELNGCLNLDKPAGMSSARAVDRVKRILPRKTKIGHAGTLDPFATGVLVLLIGRATKQCESLMDQPKQYEATVKFGATTATDDPESAEAPFSPGHAPGYVAGSVTLPQIRNVLPRFIGQIQQRPPAYSALKVGGKRAYNLARSGESVELQARTVQVYGIELLEYAWPLLRLRIDCGRGTYIRAIARDLGEALGVGGYLTELRRTRIGSFAIEHAVTMERILQDGVTPHLCDASTR